MKTLSGDLIALALAGKFDVIIHGCNCQCVMGRGVAKRIKDNFPEAYEADLKTKKGDITKLGTFSYAEINYLNRNLIVVNAYVQIYYGIEKNQVDYDAVRQVMRMIKVRFSGLMIGYPKIGAGLAGGDWSIITAIIDTELSGEDHTVVEL